MVGPQFLYVDEDWANSSLRRKLFGRPQHREKSVTDEDRVKEVCECITLGEVLFIPLQWVLQQTTWMSCLRCTDRQMHSVVWH